MLISTINCPVLVSTAVCSIRHSSGAPRLALLHRALQPGGAGGVAASASACAGAGAGVAGTGAAFGGGAPFGFGARGDPGPGARGALAKGNGMAAKGVS